MKEPFKDLLRERPVNEDAYFVFLMLHISAGVIERATAETALKQALKQRKQMKVSRKGKGILEMNEYLLRRKWDELASQ